MHRVEKDHIKNEHIRNIFGVADIHDQLQIRTFRWLGQLAQQPDDKGTKRLLSLCGSDGRRLSSQGSATLSRHLESIFG
jgi:hypothetical protein